MTCSSSTTFTPERLIRRVTAAIVLLAAVLALASLVPGAGDAAPGSGPEHAARAVTLLDRGDAIAAEAELRRALAAGAPPEAIAARMGEALIAQGKTGEARTWLGEGRFTPDQALHGWRMVARLERADGNNEAAATAFARALEIAPGDSMLWVDIGRLRYAMGAQVQAMEAVERAIRLDPGNPRALQFGGQLVRDRVGLVAALPWFEAGLEAAPEDVELMGDYAATLGELGRAHDMLAVTRRMTGNRRAFYLQAVLAARAGDIDLARRMLNRAGLQQRPDSPAAQMLMGIVELDAGNANLAIDHLDALVGRQPANRPAQLLLARSMAAAGDDAGLVRRFTGDAERADAPAYLLTLVARAHERLGRRDLAAPLLDRAANIAPLPLVPIAPSQPLAALEASWREQPLRPDAAIPYIRALIDADRRAEAAEAAERLRAAHPGWGDVQALAGDAELALGNNARATERYLAAAQVRIDDDRLARMSLSMIQTGQGAAAAVLIERHLALTPSSVVAARMSAIVAGGRGDWNRARRLLEFVRDNGGWRDAHLLADLSYACLRGGDARCAQISGRAAHRLQRSSAATTQAYGAGLLASRERLPVAAALFDKARRSGGDNPLLAEALTRMAALNGG